MIFKSLVILTALAFCAHGAVISAPLAVAPYASSYTAHVTHHSVAAPEAPLVAAPLVASPAAPLIATPVVAPVAAPVAAPLISSIASQYIPSANLLLK